MGEELMIMPIILSVDDCRFSKDKKNFTQKSKKGIDTIIMPIVYRDVI